MSAVALTDAQRLDWLRLIRSERVGPRTFRSLINQFGDAAAALQALPDLARKRGRSGLKLASRAEAERELDGLRRLGARLIAQGEREYPRSLLAIDTAPPLIAVRGSTDTLCRHSVAIVGSRNASAAGGAVAARLAAELGRSDFMVVSGLARGIDTQAHKAALPTGTVAVLAGGHDRIYPAENKALLERIVAEGGAAVSEMPLAWEPRAQDFPRRNRIVSGLSYGVVVVEAARRSGSLITARFALEQGREVFAVPGSPFDPRAEGPNELIRAGATLCGRVEHILEVLAPLVTASDRDDEAPPIGFQSGNATFEGADPREFWDELDGPEGSATASTSPFLPDEAPLSDTDRVRALIGPAPVSVDELARQAEMPVRTVQLVLVELELAGLLERSGANIQSRPERPEAKTFSRD